MSGNGEVVYVSGLFSKLHNNDEERVLLEAKFQAAKRYMDRINLEELPKQGDSRCFVVIEEPR